MINNRMKLLFSAFIVILLGVVLIRPIADDVELAKVGSVNISNESVSLSATTATIRNETVTFVDGAGGGAANMTATLGNKYLTNLISLINISGENLMGFCNVTLGGGTLTCNYTGNYTGYSNYTYNSYSTGALANDELISLDGCRNSTNHAITTNIHCNVTLTTGAVKVRYSNFSVGDAYIDYTYEPDTYVHNSTARTVLTLTVLFFALLVLAVGLGYAIKSFKENNLM